MLPRLWLLVGSDRQTDRQTMSLIELSWTAKNEQWPHYSVVFVFVDLFSGKLGTWHIAPYHPGATSPAPGYFLLPRLNVTWQKKTCSTCSFCSFYFCLSHFDCLFVLISLDSANRHCHLGCRQTSRLHRETVGGAPARISTHFAPGHMSLQRVWYLVCVII